MRRTRPLPDTNPELIVIETPGLCYEYRVENWHLAQDGSRRVEQGTSRLSWKDGLFVAIAAFMWPSVCIVQQFLADMESSSPPRYVPIDLL